jgi:hypothetical protein
MPGGNIEGRRACPWCGFGHAHVKLGAGKANPYLHCPDCGMLTQARSGHQAALLRKGMRPEGAPAPAPGHAPQLPPPGPDDIVIKAPAAAPPAPAAPPRPVGLWDQLMAAKKP